MSQAALTLGPVAFGGFEVPGCLIFGGAQRLAIHRLLDGSRVIDTMGPDAANVCWAGTFSGPDATERARLLDLLRTEGAALPLFWDGFFYTVVIAQFNAEYRNPFWLPYRISCAVVRDETQAALLLVAGLAADGLADLAAAAGFGAEVGAAQIALRASGATTLGSASYAQAQVAVAASLATISGGMAAASISLGSSDFPTALGAAGTLANGSAAHGYVARVGQNLANAST